MDKIKLITSLLIISAFYLSLTSCSDLKEVEPTTYHDKPFDQEMHTGYSLGELEGNNDVRRIAIDSDQNIYAATRSGVFVKYAEKETWSLVQSTEDSGPSFDVEVDRNNNVWFSTWNGLYNLTEGVIRKIEKVFPPISTITVTKEGVFAFGHHGVWIINDDHIEKVPLNISKGVRNAFQASNGDLWISTDVGLYHFSKEDDKLYQDTNELISCYIRDTEFSNANEIWAVGLGGVSIRDNDKLVRTLTYENGIPSGEVNCVEKSPNGTMWIGTNLGVVRYKQDGSHSLRFTKRWLKSNEVRDIKFDKSGAAWIATANGVSKIFSEKYTLSLKEKYFYNRLLRRHVREPWIVYKLGLKEEGDTSTWYAMDDDNDGEYTGIYLSMESVKYSVTKDEASRERAKKAFRFLTFLQEVTETVGFFARTVVPSDWDRVHDGNRKYSEQEIADEIVKNPRFKIVEERWRKSKDGKWLWKGDTSSDEMCGHFNGYFHYYEFAADDTEKELIKDHVMKIMDYLIDNNYNFVDIDGKHTRWAVWSPDKLNRDPDWAPERYLNSFELLAFLKFTYHVSGQEKYENEYQRLINEEGYLDNASMVNHKNPAWDIYFDIPMAGYLFPILVKYETDPKLKKFYEDLMDEWFEKQISGHNPLNNFTYCFARNKRVEIANSVNFLIDTPLDLVDWKIDHTKREDINIVRKPILEEMQISVLPPASERATVRWDKNPWAAIHGSSYAEREPVFWLFPYWMGRYLEIISE